MHVQMTTPVRMVSVQHLELSVSNLYIDICIIIYKRFLCFFLSKFLDVSICETNCKKIMEGIRKAILIPRAIN